MLADPWLQLWLPALAKASGASPVLEIGCGSGADTAELLRSGLQVVAFDLSPEAVAAARQAAPGAEITVQSVEQPFPLEGAGIGAVIASLSLHYFSWTNTLSLVGRVRATLKPGGILLCRLNSTEDTNYGSVGHREIEPGLFLVNGHPKRFFSESDIDALFKSGWKVLGREHKSSSKYGLPKYMWEVAAARDA
jgi:SAM-dependent methyltransferase